MRPTAHALRTINRGWLAARQADVGSQINGFAFQFLGGILDSKSVRSTATTGTCAAALVFPILPLYEKDVHTPDDHGLALLNGLCRIYKVSPDDIPARVVIVATVAPTGACCLWIPRPSLVEAACYFHVSSGREIVAARHRGAG